MSLALKSTIEVVFTTGEWKYRFQSLTDWLFHAMLTLLNYQWIMLLNVNCTLHEKRIFNEQYMVVQVTSGSRPDKLAFWGFQAWDLVLYEIVNCKCMIQ